MGEQPQDRPVERIVMQAPVTAILAAATPWPNARPMIRDDVLWVAQASWEAYPHRPPFDTWESVLDLSRAALEGEWGDFMAVASPVARTDDDEIAGGVATVLRLTRDGAPDCPYILNCLTLPAHRRRGVAAGMLAAAALGAKAVGETHLALTVDEPNVGARALYGRLGFLEIARVAPES